MNSDHRILTLEDVEQAAQVVSPAFVDDPLVSFMLPFRATRVKTLYKFFRVYIEINIQNQRGYGVGSPLQGVAFWKFPDHENLSIRLKSLGKLLPLFLTMYPIGYMRARPILNQIETLHQKYATRQ